MRRIHQILPPALLVGLAPILAGAEEADGSGTLDDGSSQIASESPGSDSGSANPLVVGFRGRAGGRYDDVRMCVGSPAGAKGGPAADVSLFAELPLGERLGLDLDLPLMRPVMFAAAFEMLQFEPSASLRFRKSTSGSIDPIFGPTLGLSLHYGPDYTSEASGTGRGPSFFAMGPILGGYGGLDFKRPGKSFNFQLGLSAYVTPLFSVDDPANHQGVVAGGSLDASFRFRL